MGRFSDKVKSQIDELLAQRFKPEFLNRIDSIVYFTSLTESEVEQIAQLQINALIARLKTQGLTLTVSPDLVAHIAESGYSPDYGARPLKRTITQQLMVPLSQYLLAHRDSKSLRATLHKGKVTIESH
jgi:ATP-dependent Clp protease ATP-binding subunit ClpA